MTWAKVDDRTHEDPRSDAAGLEAMGLWVLALSYMGAHRTDGRISVERCRRLAGAQKGKRLADRLVAAGWWELEAEGVYRLVEWEQALLPRSQAEERSARAAAAGRKGGEAKAARTPKVAIRSGASSEGTLAPSPEPCGGSLDGNPSESKETALPTPAPDPDPTRPERAHTRTCGDPPEQGDTLPLFDRSSIVAPRASSAEPRGRSRSPKGGKEPRARAEDRYADAYAAGSLDAGFPITPLLPSERGLLGPIAATHARYRDGSPIIGDDLPSWFRQRARAFRTALLEMPYHRGGASVLGFRNWLDEGADGEERPLAPGQEEPAEDTDAELLELMRAEDAKREAARQPRPASSGAALDDARRTVYRFAGKSLPEEAGADG